MKLLGCAVIALMLTGCAGANYALKHYASVPHKAFTASTGSAYRVYDKPTEDRMMITPSLSASMGGGAVKGATWGMVNPLTGTAAYRSAAEEYLRSTGRECTAQNIELILEPQYEVRYTCTPQVGGSQ